MKTWSQDLATSWYTNETAAPCTDAAGYNDNERMAHFGNIGELDSPRMLVVRISDIIRVFVSVPSPGG